MNFLENLEILESSSLTKTKVKRHEITKTHRFVAKSKIRWILLCFNKIYYKINYIWNKGLLVSNLLP